MLQFFVHAFRRLLSVQAWTVDSCRCQLCEKPPGEKTWVSAPALGCDPINQSDVTQPPIKWNEFIKPCDDNKSHSIYYLIFHKEYIKETWQYNEHLNFSSFKRANKILRIEKKLPLWSDWKEMTTLVIDFLLSCKNLGIQCAITIQNKTNFWMLWMSCDNCTLFGYLSPGYASFCWPYKVVNWKHGIHYSNSSEERLSQIVGVLDKV